MENKFTDEEINFLVKKRMNNLHIKKKMAEKLTEEEHNIIIEIQRRTGPTLKTSTPMKKIPIF